MSPVVNIVSPSENTIYQVFDTVQVSLTAMDETSLNSVTAQIVDANFVAVTGALPVNVSAQNASGHAEIVIDDKLLPTADYYVLVRASDGANETNEYRKIKIVALPKKRRAVYYSTVDGNSNGSVWKVDSLFQGTELWIQPGQDILKLCVNSLTDRLSLVGNYSTGIFHYDIPNRTVVWSDQVFTVAQTERFKDLTCFENTTYTALYDRELRSYGLNGSLTMNLQTGDYRPELLFVNEDFLAVEMNLVGGNEHFIFVYNRATRVLLWQLQLPMDLVAVCPYQSNEVFLFGNDGSQARVLQYDLGTNAYWEPRQLPTGKVLDAVQMDGAKYAIAHENGLYSYTYSPNYLNLITAGTSFQSVSFDVDNATLIGATQNVLNEITTNGQVIHTIVATDSITSADIHYTR